MTHNRTFGYAVTLSAALHALVLFGVQNPPDPARRAARFPPPILARLVEPEPAPVPEPPAKTVEPAPRAAPAAPRAAAPVPPPAPLAARPEPPAPAPAPQRADPSAPAAPPAIEPEPPSAALAPQPARPPSEPPAPESLSRDQYRLQLIDEARRHKRYPPLARDNNWEGGVLVAVVVGADGRPSVELKASSGYEVLDRQALEMFGNAARAVPLPPALRGKAFALELRAVYGLED